MFYDIQVTSNDGYDQIVGNYKVRYNIPEEDISDNKIASIVILAVQLYDNNRSALAYVVDNHRTIVLTASFYWNM